MSATNVFGLPVPTAGPLFYVALTVHIVAAMTCVVTGLLAATAGKRPGRHPRAGRTYLWALGFVLATATVMAAIRWRHDGQLFAIAAVAFGLAFYGWRFRPGHRPGHVRRHASGMAGSYIALFTGFYIDNGPHLPLLRLLPHWTFWLLPSAIGVPLIWRALQRYCVDLTMTPREAEQVEATPHRQDPLSLR